MQRLSQLYEGYREWKKISRFMRWGGAVLGQPLTVLRHRAALRRYLRERNEGPRIFDSKTTER